MRRSAAKNRYGVSPLSLACQNGNADAVQLLLQRGADPNTSLPGGETVLMTAARTGRLEPVKLLIAAGANVNGRERKGQTALMRAAAEGHADVVDALIEAGADQTVQLESGFNAFFFAVREGRTEVVSRLLGAGCNINDVMTTRRGFAFGHGQLSVTPLLLAVENGHFELAKWLLDHGADPNARPSGYTALHALTWVRKPILGDGDPPPTGSGKYSSLDMVRMLDARLERGRSGVGKFTYTGSTPFLLAAQTADLPMMKLLHGLGADVQLPNADGTTPLLAAAGVGALGDGDKSAGTEEESIEVIEYLIDLGADVNAVDQNGETALHGAAYQSLPKLVQVLVDRGANIEVWNRENRAGWTPLIIALGYRPGNFRPDPETIAAIEQAILAAGASLPDPSGLQSHRRTWSESSNQDRSWMMKDIEYARVNELPLRLDLYLPAEPTDSHLIVWVHGGAWRMGSKDEMPLRGLVDAGYTVASVDYRLATVAPFPAQIHDLKAAIRFLRSLSTRYGFRSDKIAIAGASAGGHLAALVGTTNGHDELEGTVGSHLDQSSDVQAIISFYGPTNLLTILPQSTAHGLSVRVPALQLLLGGQPEDNPQLASQASPVDHVDGTDPPLLLIHGDQDPQVPLQQSEELHSKYKQFAAPVQFELIQGAAHGGPEFYDDARLKIIQAFLKQL